MMHTNNLGDFYAYIQKTGKLRTPAHAERWSRAVLRTLGFNLDRGTKKKLARALPAELAAELTRPFRLIYFRDSSISQHEFLHQVSRRSGNTDPDFARYPTTAVFHGLKTYTSQELSERVAKALPPAVRQMWEEA